MTDVLSAVNHPQGSLSQQDSHSPSPLMTSPVAAAADTTAPETSSQPLPAESTPTASAPAPSTESPTSTPTLLEMKAPPAQATAAIPSAATAVTAKDVDAYAVLSGFLGDQPFEERILSLPTTLGRSAAGPNHLHIGNAEVLSRVHAEISWEESQNSFILTCRSKNGCLVDGIQVIRNKSAALKNGAAIKIGEARLYFLLPVNAKEQYASRAAAAKDIVSTSTLVDEAFNSNNLEVKHGGISQKAIIDYIISAHPENYVGPEKRKALNGGVHKLLKRKYREIEVPNPKEGKQPFLYWCKK